MREAAQKGWRTQFGIFRGEKVTSQAWGYGPVLRFSNRTVLNGIGSMLEDFTAFIPQSAQKLTKSFQTHKARDKRIRKSIELRPKWDEGFNGQQLPGGAIYLIKNHIISKPDATLAALLWTWSGFG
jgi:hypothetical protein